MPLCEYLIVKNTERYPGVAVNLPSQIVIAAESPNPAVNLAAYLSGTGLVDLFHVESYRQLGSAEWRIFEPESSREVI